MLSELQRREVERLIEEVEGDEDILAVFLFGSRARGDERPDSDADICLVMRGDPSEDEMARKKLRYLKFSGLDIHLFNALPIYIRRRVLKEGKLLFVRDEDELYEVAFRTVQAFEDFKHLYYDYLREIERDR